MPARPAIRRLIGAALLLLAAAGCDRGSDELSLLTSGQRYLDAEDGDAAVIQLKALVGRQPQSGQARLLFGKALLMAGNPAGAEAELRRADQLGAADYDVMPLLASALLAQRQPERVLKELGGLTPKGDAKGEAARPGAVDAGQAELRVQVALAHAELQQLDRAEALVDAILGKSPQHTAALLLKARIAAAKGQRETGQRIAAELVAREKDNALAWALQGDLLQLPPGDENAALAAYRQALQLRPRLVLAHTGALTLLIRRGDLAAVRQQFAPMQQALPRSTATIYFDAVIHYLGNNTRKARELAQQLLAISPDTPQLLLLASLCELRLGGEKQAVTMLQKALTIVPGASEPRYLLARVELRGGRAEQALEALRPLLDSATTDTEALTLAAQAHLLGGNPRQADLALARAAAAQPGDAGVRTAIARTLLARGQLEPGLRELQAAANAQAEGGEADLLLIAARLRRGELDAAQKAIDELARKQPARALPDQLRGQVALMRRDDAAARAAFDRALGKEPDFLPSLARLADLDLAANRVDAARQRYQALLQRRPDHVDAMLALATLERRGGNPPAMAGWLAKAARANPKDARTWQQAIDRLLGSGETSAALALAEEAVKTLPDQPELLQRLAGAQVAAGAHKAALETLARQQKLGPPTAAVHLLYAQAYAGSGDDSSVRVHLQSALALAPDWPPALRAGAEFALRRNRFDDALAAAAEVQGRYPADALGFLLEGGIHVGRQQWPAAAAAFRRALDKRNPGDAAQRLHFALLRSDRSAAQAFEADWLRRHPADVAFLHHLGEMALLRDDFAAADRAFRKVLERDPDHVSALNNRAFVLVRSQQPGALPLAAQAARLAPEQAEVLDTLAAAHAQAGDVRTAVAWQERAVALAPQGDGLRLALARLYLAAGDRGKARAELERLARLGPSFTGAAEVAQLLKTADGK